MFYKRLFYSILIVFVIFSFVSCSYAVNEDDLNSTSLNSKFEVSISSNAHVDCLDHINSNDVNITSFNHHVIDSVSVSADVINNPKIVSEKELFSASNSIKDYFENNHKLPSVVSVGENQLDLTEYILLAGKLITSESNTSFYLNEPYFEAFEPFKKISGGVLNSSEYFSIFSRCVEFIKKEGRAPNYVSSYLGDIRFESVVLLASNILYSKSINLDNPYFLTITPWSVISSTTTNFYSEDDVLDAVNRTKIFIDKNKILPNYVTINNNKVSMSSFLKLISSLIINIEGNHLSSSIPCSSYKSANNPIDSLESSCLLSKNDYLLYAVRINNFMNIYNHAPNYVDTSHGYIGYNNAIYIFSQILNYYDVNEFLPDSIVINPWFKIINGNTRKVSITDILTAANNIKKEVIYLHKLPSSLKIGSITVSLDTFLELGSEVILSENFDLCSDFIVNSFGNVNSSDSGKFNINLVKNDYIDLINNLINYLFKNKKAPSKLTQSFVLNGSATNFTFSHNSLVYLVTDILASYNLYNSLPENYEYVPWIVINNPERIDNHDKNNVSSLSNSKFIANDMIVHENTIKNFTISLVNHNSSPVTGVDVDIKILDYDFNLLRNYSLITDNKGQVNVPCRFSKGVYTISYSIKDTVNGSYGMNKIEVIPYKIPIDDGVFVDFKIPTSLLVKSTNIYLKGDFFKGRLVDKYYNPIKNKTINLIDVDSLENYNGVCDVVTDDDGYFYYPINKSVGVYNICCRFVGDSEYEYVQSLISLNVSYAPNFRYLVNMTNNGREIGIYKDNVLYKYCYDCSVSGATKLNKDILYFISLDNTTSYSLKQLNSINQINSSGISLYCNGKNVLITYHGYSVYNLSYFNVIFNGKNSGNDHVCNLILYCEDVNVASLYFSSEKNVKGYAPVYTNFTLFNKNYKPNSIFYDDFVSNGEWMYVYYGDIGYKNYLKNAGWTSNTGYESIQSYLICDDYVSDEIMKVYLANVSKYSNVMKVVYANFLTSLTYEWLNAKLADELAEECRVSWKKQGCPLISSSVGINGHFINVLDSGHAVSGCDYNRFKLLYDFYSSLLEEYVMSLTGSNATCAVSEVLKGLLNGEEFYYYWDNKTSSTILKLADNSSYLRFSALGDLGTIINCGELNNKYNGGLCLGKFSYVNDNICYQLGNLIDLLDLKSQLFIFKELSNQIYNNLKFLPGGEVIAPYAANLILGLIGSEAFWYGYGIVSLGVSISAPELLLGVSLMSGGVALVSLSNGAASKDYTSSETFSFSLLDIVTSGALGKGVDAVCKFGLSGSSKTIYKTINVFLSTSISETVKEVSKFYSR